MADPEELRAAQRRAWDGPAGDLWSVLADWFERGVADYDEAYLAAVDAGPADRVLDVGCGPGALTLAIARRAGSVTGIDLSHRVLELARTRAGGADVTFRVADAETDDLGEDAYDLVVSHFGTMFFADPVAAFTNLRRALRPGGRLVLLVWQSRAANPWLVSVLETLGAPALPPDEGPSPFGLSDPARTEAVLTAAGFVDVVVEPRVGSMWFGEDVDDAARHLEVQHAALLGGLDADDRERALERLRGDLAAHRGAAGVAYDSAVWLVTAR
ncbi:class I SAM-dependent methyltransferase [Actinomycetospora atypica]|uniref:Class I SAM-dependent methyltransferase n=1 Tax=Actinomycetospora atypica TaxID=1290095 RepID=A0ABV9YD85_9PSEU